MLKKVVFCLGYLVFLVSSAQGGNQREWDGCFLLEEQKHSLISFINTTELDPLLKEIFPEDLSVLCCTQKKCFKSAHERLKQKETLQSTCRRYLMIRSLIEEIGDDGIVIKDLNIRNIFGLLDEKIIYFLDNKKDPGIDAGIIRINLTSGIQEEVSKNGEKIFIHDCNRILYFKTLYQGQKRFLFYSIDYLIGKTKEEVQKSILPETGLIWFSLLGTNYSFRLKNGKIFANENIKEETRFFWRAVDQKTHSLEVGVFAGAKGEVPFSFKLVGKILYPYYLGCPIIPLSLYSPIPKNSLELLKRIDFFFKEKLEEWNASNLRILDIQEEKHQTPQDQNGIIYTVRPEDESFQRKPLNARGELKKTGVIDVVNASRRNRDAKITVNVKGSHVTVHEEKGSKTFVKPHGSKAKNKPKGKK